MRCIYSVKVLLSLILGVYLVGRESGWLWRVGMIGSIDRVGRCWASELGGLLYA